MPSLRVQNLVKSFGGHRVLDGVGFEARDGEFLTMLGPSGCGKTTTLLCIAGLEDPEEGIIEWGGNTYFDRAGHTNVAAEKRNLGVVFQSYAIWPHMTVFENVAFPLRLRKVSRAQIHERVGHALALTEMEGFAGRYPHQLSGGQQQRVALARALSYSPSVLLLDEPFSNLDAKLRERARASVRALQQRLQLTTILVTHDQHEALSMSDRVLVMEHGNILQAGPPEEIYRRPANRFVADFVGRCNFLSGVATRTADTGSVEIAIDGGDLRLHALLPADAPLDGSVTVAIRPEAIDLDDVTADSGDDTFRGLVTNVAFLGDHYECEVRVGGTILVVTTRRHMLPEDQVGIRIPTDACAVMSPGQTSGGRSVE